MITYPDPHSRSAHLADRARAVLPGGHTRLTTHFLPYPLYAASGEGAYLIDVDGNRFLDYIGNYSAAIHGHLFRPSVDALITQLNILGAVGLPTALEIDLAELICSRIASIEQIRFCNSGSEAVMLAIKAARAFTGRSKIAKLEGAYHGSDTAIEASTLPDPGLWGPAHAPNPVAYAQGTPLSVLDETLILPSDDVAASVAMLLAHRSDLAAVIIDPAMSRTGYMGPQPDYISAIQTAARAAGALVIADEVYSFRLAYNGAQVLLGLEPDLTALGKIIGGGIPIGAIGGRRDVMGVFKSERGRPPVPHGGTFNGNPLAMAAGLAAMRALTPEAYDRLNNLGDRLRDGLRTLFNRSSPIQVQGRGSLTSVIFSPTPPKSVRAHLEMSTASARQSIALQRSLIRRGVLSTPQGQFVISTPMTEDNIDSTLAAVADSLREILDPVYEDLSGLPRPAD